ncbi:unnamed protein product [Paramecium primaurelia]|uniref:RING-type domain-containing protein n=1 Tax=Paramecium primaurelia TaxID=5886 RepID=A0A8S1QCS1_PARPR|nr:unnamed protein product [Paramecium primaurelia]
MLLPRIRIQFTLSEKTIKILDLSLLGLAILTCYKLYKCDSKRNEEKQKLKRFKYLYTADECHLLKIDSKQITVQGQINNDNQFLQLKSYQEQNKGQNVLSNIYSNESILIFDPYTKTEIIGKITKDCQFDLDLFNYHRQWKYQTCVNSESNFIVRLYQKIKNYFFGKTLVENINGIDLNQYFIFKGILKQQESELMLEIDHIGLTPNLIYQQIKKNLKKYKVQEFILSMILTSLMYYFYKKMKEFIQIKVLKKELFQNKIDEIAEDSDLCITCMTNVRNILILPCFHLICCKECLDQIAQSHYQCPLCRTQITQLKQVYIDNIY